MASSTPTRSTWGRLKEEPSMTKLPPEIAKLAPQRKDFSDPEEYKEALAFFHHRYKHLAKQT